MPARNKYLVGLDEVWKKHLAPRQEDAPTVISTFAGCGGSSLGYSMAGYRELLAVEWDDNAVATFKLNFPEVSVFHGDIAKLSVNEVLQRTGLKPGQLDVFDGSPPCQGFSTAGKREVDDPRNSLFKEFVRLLCGLQPRVFVMENVSGMVKGLMKLVFAEVLQELKASGYNVRARLLNAKFFGVPQSRERMIFVGVREDLQKDATHPQGIKETISLREALEFASTKEDLLPSKCSPLRVKRWHETSQGKAHHERFALLRLSWDRPAPTILKVPGSGGHMHPDEPRLLTANELKRLASFPDAFCFAGKWNDAVCRIGNSVPPLLMKHIAEHIRKTIITPTLRQPT